MQLDIGVVLQRSPAVRILLLAVAVLLAAWFRFDGARWDDGSYAHPDERHMAMVASGLGSGRLIGLSEAALQECRRRHGPEGVGSWLDGACSDLNPLNAGFKDFAYGQLPLLVVRQAAVGIAQATGRADWTELGGIVEIGRAFSAVCDLLTVLVVFLLGRQLWGRGVGVLAAALYGFAVLPIQLAHFFTVDTSATLFATLALLFLIRLQRFGQLGDAVAFGIAFGLGLACKISIAPLIVMLALAAAWAPIRLAFAKRPDLFTRILVRLPPVIVGLAAVWLTFRLASPAAFGGAGWIDLWPAQSFIEQTERTRQISLGFVDIPPNWQWLGRTPWVWPGMNLVVWGLGPALGFAAAIALVLQIPRFASVSPMNRARALAWLWAVGYFVWMGQQWVSSMRYFLPIYPVLCVFAGAWLVTRWRKRRLAHPRRTNGTARFTHRPYPVAALVVITASLLWAFAFHQVHRSLHPYVAATHWMLRNVPAPVYARTAESGSIAIGWGLAGRYGDTQAPGDGVRSVAMASGDIETASLFRIRREEGEPAVSVQIYDEQDKLIARSLPAALEFGASDVLENVRLPLSRAVTLVEGQAYRVQVSVTGGLATLEAATIGTEGGWTDQIPMRISRQPFGASVEAGSPSGTTHWRNPNIDPFAHGYYRALDFAMVEPDDARKRERLIAAAGEMDWLVVPNERLYTPMRRNPLRFPMTVAFYQGLFDGTLGYELALTSTSWPRLGPLSICDHKVPVKDPQCSIEVPEALAAEEAFSVYDHPAVMIFRKADGEAGGRVRALLSDINLTTLEEAKESSVPRVAGRLTWSTREADQAPDGMLAIPLNGKGSTIAVRDASERHPAYPVPWHLQLWFVLLWYGATVWLGLVAWVWLARLWPQVPDRGYAVARITGLVACALPAWWLAGLNIPAWSLGGLLAISGGMTVLTLIASKSFGGLQSILPAPVLRRALIIEAVFAALFALGLLLRLLHPDLWSPGLGGEKPMEFAIFNRVLDSSSFPPDDPWFAGGRLNYYYFGYVLVGVLAKLTQTPSAMAFNFALATWYAMLGIGVGGIACNLWAALGLQQRRRYVAWIAGGFALVSAALLGNMDLARIAGPGLFATVSGLTGAMAELRPVDWFWAPSRTIGRQPGASFEVNEFPAFSFLLGDLHPHLLALPLQLMALFAISAMAISRLSRQPSAGGAQRGIELWRVYTTVAFLAVPVALLRATNAWDWPFYMVFACMATVLFAWPWPLGHEKTGDLRVRVTQAGLGLLLFVFLEHVLRWPFASFATGAVSLHLYTGRFTSLVDWVTIQGWFIVVIAGWLWLIRPTTPLAPPAPPWAATTVSFAATALQRLRKLGVLFTLIAAGAYLVGATPSVPALGLQFALLAWAGETLLRTRTDNATRAALVLTLAGLALTLFVEFFVIGRDMGRMNTYFKLHMQAWVLLSIASGIALARLSIVFRPRWRARAGGLQRGLLGTWACVFTLATLIGLLYLPAGTVGRAMTRFDPGAAPTLDGEAFLTHAVYDYEGHKLPLTDDKRLIEWLRAHAAMDSIILEAQLPEHRWGSRISVHTGLPTLLGYRYHEAQQRPLPALHEAIELRRRNVAALYAGVEEGATIETLRRYGVRYIVVGGLERTVYPVAGLAKFERLVAAGELEVAFQGADDRIYRVIGTTVPTAPAW
ncbi:DUF2298 domain-containing protein [Ottowia thiooxydans]|uniref:DUF2298 domain-containing protein n=1 Tax=Ottowia thiooxydans TaxID=219182 RepID=UPI00048AE710|nr:DUF2298 domain-containing protein [Ottowia thiooxydans]